MGRRHSSSSFGDSRWGNNDNLVVPVLIFKSFDRPLGSEEAGLHSDHAGTPAWRARISGK